jgi:hypothetical protein
MQREGRESTEDSRMLVRIRDVDHVDSLKTFTLEIINQHEELWRKIEG